MRHHAPQLTLLAALLLTMLAAPLAAQTDDAPAGNDLPSDTAAPTDMPAPSDTPAPAESTHSPHAHIDELMQGSSITPEQHRDFARNVDLSKVRKLAVFDNGRVKILETLANEYLNRVTGDTAWEDPETGTEYDPVFTYLDIYFNKPYYVDKRLIHVGQLPLRQDLVAHLDAQERRKWRRQTRMSAQMLWSPPVLRVLRAGNVDQRHHEARNALVNRVLNAFPQLLGRAPQEAQTLRMVSPPKGQAEWASLRALRDQRVAAAQPTAMPAPTMPVANADAAQAVNGAFDDLQSSWSNLDAQGVNGALDVLGRELPRINPSTYPPQWKLTLESIYNATHKFTLGWIAYFIGTVVLLIAFTVARKWMIITGAALAGLGFVIHTAGMITRGIISGRWPIHNQFESFIAVSWFAVLVGLVFMLVRRQWLFGAAAAALGTCALMLANRVDIPSNDVAQVAGILDTSNILYIHVNVVLCSYALIALGFFISLYYLAVHYFGKQNGGDSGNGGGASGGGSGGASGGGMLQFAAAGLGHEVNRSGDGALALARGRAAVLHDLDRAQMIVLQLAFWLLGTGVLLGAYWADHAWGRWWGWDPKETWALITWIVYLIAIHARFGVKQRGLVTAWLSVVGFFVMLWTHWGVNMLLAGLHSYA